MGRGPCAFTEAEVRRAVKACREAGMMVAGVRFSRTGFTVLAGQLGEAVRTNTWDEVLKKNEDEPD